MDLSVMTFNVLMGGGDEERFDGVLRVIADARPDLLVLQECLGWSADGARTALVAGALEVPNTPEHVVFGQARPRGSGRCYHVLVFSRHPVTSSRCHADPDHQAHALVEFEIDVGGSRIRGFGTHMDAHSENLRLGEALYLRSLLEEGELAARPRLLLGDLNSMSPRDPYPEDLPEKLRAAGTTKFGDPPRVEVIPELEGQGWIDALYAGDTSPESWVTAPRDRGGVHIDYRTDFVFFSGALRGAFRGARVIPLQEGESDHYPLIAEFDV